MKERLQIAPGRGAERVSSVKMPIAKIIEEIKDILPTIKEHEFVVTRNTRPSTRTVDKELDKYRKQTGVYKDSPNAPTTGSTNEKPSNFTRSKQKLP